MTTIVRLPKLGLSDRGEIVEWLVSDGDHVSEEEVIAVLESDKSSVEIEAPTDGILLTKYVEEGAEVPISPGRPIAAIGEEGEEPPATEDVDEGTDDAESAVKPRSAAGGGDSPTDTNRSGSERKVSPRAAKLAEERGIDPQEVPGTGPEGAVTASDVEDFEPSGQVADDTGSQADDDADQKVTPKARRFAAQNDVDLSRVTGTGPKGAITEADVQTRLEESPSPAEKAQGGRTVSKIRQLTSVERTVADRLTESALKKPHVKGSFTVSVERLEALVSDLSESGMEVGLNDMLLRAVALTLRDNPKMNAVYQDGEHRLIEEVNVGYAVDTGQGLIVPVIREASDLSVAELAKRRRSVVERVREGEQDPSDLQDGTFTISNVGALGLDSAFSIINPPQVAILSVGRHKPELFERDGEFVAERAVKFGLIIDHQVLDGGDAGRFGRTLRSYIERPGRILAE